MFGFFNELIESAFVNEDFNLNNFRYVNIANKIFYLEGIVKVFSFSKESISLKTKRNIITVSGNELKICELSANVILFKGKINKIEVL